MTKDGAALPTVSVVTICYDSAPTIERTLRSVRDCPYPELEYVVADGGSRDGTLEILGRYEGAITSLVSERDGGISDAFNKGIARATGEWVGLVNADDFLIPEAPARVVDVASRHPDADVIYGDALIIEGDRTSRMPSCPDLTGIAIDFPMAHCATWVRREAYERFGGYSEGFRYAMDYEWVYRAHRQGAVFVRIPELLGAFRMGGINTRFRIATMREVERLQVLHGTPRAQARRMLAKKVARYGLIRVLPAPVLQRIRRGSRARRAFTDEDPRTLGVSDYV